MSTLPQDSDFAAGYAPIVVHLQPVLNLSDDQLYDFARINRELRIERNAHGELLIMPPTGGDTGERNAEITMQLRVWAKADGTGVTFDSSTGFRLGLLIDRVRRCVYVYQPGTPVQVIDDPDTIPGTPVLSGFALALREIW